MVFDLARPIQEDSEEDGIQEGQGTDVFLGRPYALVRIPSVRFIQLPEDDERKKTVIYIS